MGSGLWDQCFVGLDTGVEVWARDNTTSGVSHQDHQNSRQLFSYELLFDVEAA